MPVTPHNVKPNARHYHHEPATQVRSKVEHSVEEAAQRNHTGRSRDEGRGQLKPSAANLNCNPPPHPVELLPPPSVPTQCSCKGSQSSTPANGSSQSPATTDPPWKVLCSPETEVFFQRLSEERISVPVSGPLDEDWTYAEICVYPCNGEAIGENLTRLLHDWSKFVRGSQPLVVVLLDFWCRVLQAKHDDRMALPWTLRSRRLLIFRSRLLALLEMEKRRHRLDGNFLCGYPAKMARWCGKIWEARPDLHRILWDIPKSEALVHLVLPVMDQCAPDRHSYTIEKVVLADTVDLTHRKSDNTHEPLWIYPCTVHAENWKKLVERIYEHFGHQDKGQLSPLYDEYALDLKRLSGNPRKGDTPGYEQQIFWGKPMRQWPFRRPSPITLTEQDPSISDDPRVQFHLDVLARPYEIIDMEKLRTEFSNSNPQCRPASCRLSWLWDGTEPERVTRIDD